VLSLDDFGYATEAISHTRNLTFLKRYGRGTDFDLKAIWEEHCYFEFEDSSVAKTIRTMVQKPYVNHLPTVNIPVARPAWFTTASFSDDQWYWKKAAYLLLPGPFYLQQPAGCRK
jgi:hypothetical protein